MDEKEKEEKQRKAMEAAEDEKYPYADDMVDWDMPEMREPDFSEVRKKIFSPWKIIIFLIVSSAFWIWFYFYSGK